MMNGRHAVNLPNGQKCNIQYVQSQGRHQGLHNYAKGEMFDR